MLFFIILKNLLILPLFAIPHKIVVDSKVIYQGRQLSAPRITMTQGRRALVTETDQRGRTKFSLELKPISSSGDNVKMEYSLLFKEAKNEVHSHGIVSLSGGQKGQIFIDKGRIQIQLKISR